MQNHTLQKRLFDERRDLVNELMESVRWYAPTEGYCECPGADNHTTVTGPKDCRVAVDGTATVFCFHHACSAEVAAVNETLRIAIEKAEGGFLPPSVKMRRIRTQRREEQKRLSQALQDALAFEKARQALPSILKEFAWAASDAQESSPVRVNMPPREQSDLFLKRMFKPSDVVWIGEKYDSGRPEHTKHFCTVGAWLSCSAYPGELTCATTFIPGMHSRKKENVASQPYIVLEGDTVDLEGARKAVAGEPMDDLDKQRNRAACLAVLNWFRLKTPLVLRAVVDAGNKSMHGWFDLPDEKMMAELKFLLPALGFDPAVLRLAQPVRFAGVKRLSTGAIQKLIYLNPHDYVSH